MVKTAKRKHTRRPVASPAKPFVVYVTFPSSTKEYCYLCNIDSVDVGSNVIANGSVVKVHRVASFDSIATKYVQSADEFEKSRRRNVIHDRLVTLERQLAQHERWKILARKSPEARRLLKELESL